MITTPKANSFGDHSMQNIISNSSVNIWIEVARGYLPIAIWAQIIISYFLKRVDENPNRGVCPAHIRRYHFEYYRVLTATSPVLAACQQSSARNSLCHLGEWYFEMVEDTIYGRPHTGVNDYRRRRPTKMMDDGSSVKLQLFTQYDDWEGTRRRSTAALCSGGSHSLCWDDGFSLMVFTLRGFFVDIVQPPRLVDEGAFPRLSQMSAFAWWFLLMPVGTGGSWLFSTEPGWKLQNQQHVISRNHFPLPAALPGVDLLGDCWKK